MDCFQPIRRFPEGLLTLRAFPSVPWPPSLKAAAIYGIAFRASLGGLHAPCGWGSKDPGSSPGNACLYIIILSLNRIWRNRKQFIKPVKEHSFSLKGASDGEKTKTASGGPKERFRLPSAGDTLVFPEGMLTPLRKNP